MLDLSAADRAEGIESKTKIIPYHSSIPYAPMPSREYTAYITLPEEQWGTIDAEFREELMHSVDVSPTGLAIRIPFPENTFDASNIKLLVRTHPCC